MCVALVGGGGGKTPPVIRGCVHILSITSRSSSDAFFFFFPCRDSLQDFCPLCLPHLPPQEHSTYPFGGKLHSEPSLLPFFPPFFFPTFSSSNISLNVCCVTGTGLSSKEQKPSSSLFPTLYTDWEEI